MGIGTAIGMGMGIGIVMSQQQTRTVQHAKQKVIVYHTGMMYCTVVSLFLLFYEIIITTST